MKSLKNTHYILAAIAVIMFTSLRTFAAVNAYLYIEDAKGSITKVQIGKDGTFSVPNLKKGSYTFSWSLSSPPASASQAGKVAVTGYSTSSSGDRPAESISFTFRKIEMTYAIVSPRDAQSGLPTGKRMHKPLTIMKETDKASPVLYTKLGIVIVDVDNDGISGTIVTWDAKGNKSSMDDWSK
jgi:hypothetical protein